MTISLSDNTPRISYTVNEGATQTAFTVPFEFFAEADLNFYVDGTKKTLTTHYTISGGNGSTGTINTTSGNSVTGASGGSTVVITRSIALSRTTDFPVSGSFSIDTLNTELDRFVAIQADNDDTIDRALHLADSDSAVSMELPLVAARKGTVLGFNASTGAAEVGPTIANVNSLSAITNNINITASIAENVTIVAGIASNVTTVAGIASNVTSVAGAITNINALAASAVIADMALLGNADVIADMALLATSDVIADMNTLATSDIVSDLNTLATSDIVSDINTLATSDIVSDLNTLATSDIVTDLNLLATSAIVEDLSLLATSSVIADMASLAGSGANPNITSLTASGEIAAASLDISGNIDVDGIANLDVVDIDGAVDMATTLTVAGNVGIGATSPAQLLEVSGNGGKSKFTRSGSSGTAMEFYFGGTQAGGIQVQGTGLGIGGAARENDLFIDSSGNVGIGTGTIANEADHKKLKISGGSGTGAGIIEFADTSNNIDGAIFADGGNLFIVADRDDATADSSIRFRVDGSSEKMRIDSSGRVGIGTSVAPAQKLTVTGVSGANVGGLTNGILALTTGTGAITDTRLLFGIVDDSYAWLQAADYGAAYRDIILSPNGGSVLVGTTSNSVYNDSSGTGIALNTGQIQIAGTGTPLYVNRQGSDGDLVDFRKDGSTVGNIGTIGTDMYIGTTDTGLRFLDSSNAIIPARGDTGATRDDSISFGTASARYDNIYATNGTIQTSDQTEKQDIASLTATEMLVGKRISALFKTFRWKDSVAEKGDNARTHTGIIAQDVQAAFTAEGLDAGDYSLFISSTWLVDSEGNEVEEGTEGAVSKTRMGIRYPELLSFVAAYNEQRFASIEARITALEG
jgi:hypothetical protein